MPLRGGRILRNRQSSLNNVLPQTWFYKSKLDTILWLDVIFVPHYLLTIKDRFCGLNIEHLFLTGRPRKSHSHFRAANRPRPTRCDRAGKMERRFLSNSQVLLVAQFHDRSPFGWLVQDQRIRLGDILASLWGKEY